MLEDLVKDSKELPHLRGDGLTCEAKGQRQDLFIELCRDKKSCSHTHKHRSTISSEQDQKAWDLSKFIQFIYFPLWTTCLQGLYKLSWTPTDQHSHVHLVCSSVLGKSFCCKTHTHLPYLWLASAGQGQSPANKSLRAAEWSEKKIKQGQQAQIQQVWKHSMQDFVNVFMNEWVKRPLCGLPWQWGWCQWCSGHPAPSQSCPHSPHTHHFEEL